MSGTLVETTRFIGVCKSCRKVHVQEINGRRRGFMVDGCSCHPKARVKLSAVLGAVSTKKCDARCLNARGHVCDCSCGGKNHGAGHL